MIEFLSENKEWLFSGIGVTVLVAGVYFLRSIFRGIKVPVLNSSDKVERYFENKANGKMLNYKGQVIPLNIGEQIIYYPKNFDGSPYLKFDIDGHVDFKVLWQHHNSFRIEVLSMSDDAKLFWDATGKEEIRY